MGQKGRKKTRPREVDPQAKFETRKEGKKHDPEKWIHKRNLRPERKEKNTTQRSGSTSEIRDQKGRKKTRPREVDPQAKFETRKEEGKKNDPEKRIHKRNLRPERKEKKTTQRRGSTSEIRGQKGRKKKRPRE